MTQAATGVAPEGDPPARGAVIAVVGPSGVGKDSLMDFARKRFSGLTDIHFVRRMITRPKDSIGEDHEPVTAETFETLARSGAFAVHWKAHGLGYGIPASVHDDLAAGHIVIVNGSRSALDAFRTAFPRLLVINVTAHPEVLAKRLSARGRETAADIEARLARATDPLPEDMHVVTIDNSGDLAVAGRRLVDIVEGLRSEV
ncbi:phosphonate metabolism protein/1,5-bisphosphokinase (PRPP-forming) PhnN [Rhizobium sp. AQ_MP]|uniref:phosphonate metabolism protein/1,5-bisphosphokinase (PRPP-forming) PhnN n=1 Tax=Rhizobium sp. AQ_MP TaxID=2761536 RepID=UPI001639CEF1|nr:phosphonate metabolism protein/1,5-bisphosphokinase (PRPP-forming) PhnN [Rhizobium sp. AQ_MP]MBC2772541.1 phosphonate metabolism protein/1,5-bisphosphokinase (PRPP-forming) PhnN [Rhizobium sp. AQ_MP]